jgi:MtN3 and saliva related transmembrane protein
MSRLRRTIQGNGMVELLGFCAAGLTTIAFVPQVLKTWRTQSAADLSFPMMAAFTSGVLLWLIYGVALGSIPIIVANATTLVLNIVLIGLKVRHG